LASAVIANQANQNSVFKDWMQEWGVRKKRKWGLENISLIKDSSGRFSQVLRVRYPKVL